jgi:hypothetical protein
VEGGGGWGGTDLKEKSEDLQNTGEIVGLVLDSRGVGEEVDAEEGGTHEQHWHEPGGVVALGVGATGGGEEPVGGGVGFGCVDEWNARGKPEAETRFALAAQNTGSVAVVSAGRCPRRGAAAAVSRRQQHCILIDISRINAPKVVATSDVQTARVDAVSASGAGQAGAGRCHVSQERLECVKGLGAIDDGVGVGSARDALPCYRHKLQQVDVSTHCRHGKAAAALAGGQDCLGQPRELRVGK